MKNLIAFACFIFISLNGFAQGTNVKTIGIEGYDPVAYFTKGQAIEGTNKIASDHNGVFYYFSSSEHKALFEKNPDQYLPQYGGYCATGVATANAKFPIDPETFQVTDGKLYLFYNGPYQGAHFNGKAPWLKEENNLIRTGNTNWTQLENKK